MNKSWELIGDTFSFFIRHFVAITLIVLPFTLVFESANMLLDSQAFKESVGEMAWLTFAVRLGLTPIYQGALLLYLRSQLNGENWPIAECFKKSLTIWRPLFLVTVMCFAAVVMGLSLFIIPGIIVASRILIADVFCVVERRTPVEAMKASWQATHALRWPILSGILILAGVSLLPVWIVQQALINENASQMTFLLSQIVGGLLDSLFVVFSFRVYNETLKQTPEPV